MLQNEIKKEDWIEPCNAQCSYCFLNYTDILAENYLFRDLSKKEIGLIIKELHHQVKRCKKGELIAMEGETYDKLMIIVKGSVVGEMMDFEGRILRVDQRSAPESVATAFIFGNNNLLPITIKAMEETHLLLIPREDLMNLFSKNKTVLNNYLDIMSNLAQFLSHQLKLLGLHSIKGKMAHYLLEQVKKQGKHEIHMTHTQSELAEMFGVARPSISRALKEMNDKNYIQSKNKIVRIKDKAKLSSLLN